MTIILVIIAISTLAFAQAIRGPWLFDDPALPARAVEFDQGYPWWQPPRSFLTQLRQFHVHERILYHLVCRYLYFASRRPGTWSQDYQNVELSTVPWHLANLVVHALSTLFVYWFALGVVSPDRAAIAAAVFAIHPIQVCSVCYISGLPGMLSVMFTVIGLTHFQIGGWAHLAAAGVSQYLACRSKQEGYLYVLLYPIFFFWLL